MHDYTGMSEAARVTRTPAHPRTNSGWRCQYRLDKWTDARWRAGMPSSDSLTGEGNLQLIGGASVFWQRLITITASTSSTGAALQAFSTGNAVIGVSSSTAPPAASNIYLGGTPNFQGMTASSYPNHTDSVSSTSARTCQFRSQWTAAQANFSWQSWMVRSDSSSGSGRALNHALASLGTKTTGTWTLTVDLTLTT